MAVEEEGRSSARTRARFVEPSPGGRQTEVDERYEYSGERGEAPKFELSVGKATHASIDIHRNQRIKSRIPWIGRMAMIVVPSNGITISRIRSDRTQHEISLWRKSIHKDPKHRVEDEMHPRIARGSNSAKKVKNS